MSDRRLLDSNEDYQALAEAHGKLADSLGEKLTAAANEVATLRKTLRDVTEAWDATGWMAGHYAEAGGSIGPEMRNYQQAEAIFEQARNVLNPPSPTPPAPSAKGESE